MSQKAVKVIERIRELGLTNKQVADAVGVAERSVYRWLSGENEPQLTFVQMANFCSLLQWTVRELAEAFYPSAAFHPGSLPETDVQAKDRKNHPKRSARGGAQPNP